MKRIWKFLLLSISFTLILSGCHQNGAPTPTQPLCTYITQIDVFYQHGEKNDHTQLTRDAEMEPILHYLRLLKTYADAPEDPIRSDATQYRIILTFSDGSQRVYRQIGDLYLSCDGAPWQTLEQKQAQLLPTLLRLLTAAYAA